MSETTVDARGLLCPKPLIMTKKALGQIAVGETMTVLIDNPTSMENVERFLRDNGSTVEHTEEGGVYRLSATKGEAAMPGPDAQSYCPAPAQAAPPTLCIKSRHMGSGAEELGEILMRAFVNTIREINPAPERILFYNSGIFLTLEDSPVIDTLQQLEKSGIPILVCGTCVDYYRKKERVRVGTISNMYDIMEALARASHVIYP